LSPLTKLTSAVMALALVFSLAGCLNATPSIPPTGTPPGSTQSATYGPDDLVDPLPQLTEQGSPIYVGDHAGDVVLHETATGPSEFTIERTDAMVGVQFYIACNPISDFRIEIGTFYAGSCVYVATGSGTIPVPDGDGSFTVSVDVPDGTSFWLVGVVAR